MSQSYLAGIISGTYNPISGGTTTTVEYLVVAGGGSGGYLFNAVCGGGGAGADSVTNGRNGGSGVVILSYLTANLNVFTITGGTITTNGSYTVHTFTSAGSLVIS